MHDPRTPGATPTAARTGWTGCFQQTPAPQWGTAGSKKTMLPGLGRGRQPFRKEAPGGCPHLSPMGLSLPSLVTDSFQKKQGNGAHGSWGVQGHPAHSGCASSSALHSSSLGAGPACSAGLQGPVGGLHGAAPGQGHRCECLLRGESPGPGSAPAWL